MTNSTERPTASQRVRRSPYFLWMIWITWLPFLIPDTVQWVHLNPSLPRMSATLVVLAIFIGVYFWSTLQDAKRLVSPTPAAKGARTWLFITILFLLSCVIAWLASEHGFAWLSPFVFTIAYAGGHFPTRKALLIVVGIVPLIMAFSWLIGFGISAIWQTLFTIVVVGFVVVFLMGVIRASWELQAAREEIARLAVTNERLRIARDLHDLLGHNLSLIALKSELARRLVSIAPERAANEIGDIEQVARTTLQEVREAVASYRQPALASELEAAQEILSAAGIVYKQEGNEQMLAGVPPAIEAILSWTVREGVTNVVKHSRAKHCIISLTRDGQTVGVEIADDGQALSSINEGAGNGLRGLAERVKDCDGKFEAASRAVGGFRLAVALPLTAGKHLEQKQEESATATPTGVLRALDDIPGHTLHEQKRSEYR